MADRVDCGNGHSVPRGSACGICAATPAPKPADRIDCGNGHSIPRGSNCSLCSAPNRT